MTRQVPSRDWLTKNAKRLGWGDPEPKKTVPGPQESKKAVGGESTKQPPLSAAAGLQENRPHRTRSRGKTRLIIFVVLVIVFLAYLRLSGAL
jgi:hypothetical protein